MQKKSQRLYADVQAKREISCIQVARGLAAMMVVIFHMISIEKKYTTFSLLSDWAEFGKYGVDIFFVISGFIITWTTKKHTPGFASSVHFFWRRITRIYPLYWFFSLIVLFAWWSKPHMVNSSVTTQADILKSFLLIPQEGVPLLAVGWSLVYEIYFYIVFALLLIAPRKLHVPLLIAWAAAVSIANGAGKTPLEQIMTSPLCLEFIAGAILGSYDWKISEKANRNPFVMLGDASYSIYLSHVLVLSVLGRLWALLLDNRHLGVFLSPSLVAHSIFLVSCVICTAVFGVVTYHVVERRLLHVFRKCKIYLGETQGGIATERSTREVSHPQN